MLINIECSLFNDKMYEKRNTKKKRKRNNQETSSQLKRLKILINQIPAACCGNPESKIPAVLGIS